MPLNGFSAAACAHVEAARHVRSSEPPLSGSRGVDVTIREAYTALGLDASMTTPDQARSRFRELIRSNHPDGRPPHEQALANEATRTIVEACALLRAQGFPRVTAGANADELRYKRQAVAEPASADPLAWVDETLRDSVRSYFVGVVSLTFGVQFMMGAWTMGFRIMRRDARRFK